MATVRQLALELEATKLELRAAKDSTELTNVLDQGSKVAASLETIASFILSDKKLWWEQDLPKLAKLVKITKFEPKNEREYEDTLYDWESEVKGSGMKEEVLKQLMVHLGWEKVFHMLEGIEIPQVT